ncbi:epimerase [Plebeiibacterium marinum]|uniref:Epimerase n=1 Tax=Plebeiibacterium marinum TaxID=2992111 RepID=A0AAE3SLS1_9BACT|nr:epimerase [Plebeiobacterium marinum]MCW3806785.1 epimerase [Plebeiobacterium marinum]
MKIIITGTTGMVGEGIMLECLKLSQITEVLSVSRKPIGIKHPKLREYIVSDFLALKENDTKLKGYDACFFCAGVSSVGISEEEYKRISYETTLHFAKCLNPNSQMSFIYVSGGGTDSSEKGRMAWARIKGKTENDLMKLPFKQAFGYRIGFIVATKEQTKVKKYYRYISWLLPFIKLVMPNIVSTMQQVALSMIYASKHGYMQSVIYVKDIKTMAEKEIS